MKGIKRIDNRIVVASPVGEVHASRPAPDSEFSTKQCPCHNPR
jgi:hypothetical protein